MYKLLALFLIFGRNTIGCINKPYVTYRRLADGKTPAGQTAWIFLAIIGYFGFASLIRTGVKNPFVLTFKFNSLVVAAVIGFAGMIFLIHNIGGLISKHSRIETIFILWSYTLLPTLVWFLATSVLYILFPPPRTMTFPGKLYSLVYLVFSFTIFSWKLILYYLTLRFGLRIDLWKISMMTVLITPFVVAYAIVMYKTGIFRIPFL